jgi:hypothetical protein
MIEERKIVHECLHKISQIVLKARIPHQHLEALANEVKESVIDINSPNSKSIASSSTPSNSSSLSTPSPKHKNEEEQKKELERINKQKKWFSLELDVVPSVRQNLENEIRKSEDGNLSHLLRPFCIAFNLLLIHFRLAFSHSI